MRVFIVGASGAIGTHLVPQLIHRGHEVTGTCHSPANLQRLRALGATPVVLDLLDPPTVQVAIRDARSDAILHQATALGDARFGRSLDRTFAATNRLRTEGTDALLAAAESAGVRRVVAQSFAPYRYARTGGPVKAEDDPLDPTPPAHTEATYAAMSHVDQAVTAAGGVALRYGGFYGAPNDGLVKPVRRRFLPVIGDGGGVMSFIHLHDAAAATVLALEHDASGIYNIVDDDPAPTSDWLPALADALGAKPPRHLPAGLARLIAGPAAVITATQARGASNARAKNELGWNLRYPSWRQGFPATYAPLAQAQKRQTRRAD
jgi:nucleoside-diphosphate-sugar epimerase